ncbi:unnamed protein product, partial [Didymodactylos carnosus]
VIIFCLLFLDIGDYILQTRNKVFDLEQRLQKSKNNVQEIQNLMSTWSKTPLYERAHEKGETLLILSDLDERLNKRYREIREAGERIHILLNENKQYLEVDTNNDYWKAYVEYVDEIVTDGFYAIVQCDLDFLKKKQIQKIILIHYFKLR